MSKNLTTFFAFELMFSDYLLDYLSFQVLISNSFMVLDFNIEDTLPYCLKRPGDI